MITTLQALSPAVILIGIASAVYLLGAFVERSTCFWALVSSVAIILTGLCLFLCAADVGTSTFGTFEAWQQVVTSGGEVQPVPPTPLFQMDSIAVFGCGLTLLAGLGLVVMSVRSCGENGVSEYFASLLLVVAGGLIVAVANDLVLLFLGLELIGVPTYVLLYLPRRDTASQESVAKYFFLSIFSSALFLYGLSFLYGAVGSTNLWAIRSVFSASGPSVETLAEGSLPLAVLLVVAGLSFKIAAVPFHFYAPDVYQGTTPVLAGLLAWAPKAAGVIAILRIVTLAVNYTGSASPQLIWVIAVATMFTGNILALLQENLRRLFAYSGIAQAGYMLIGVGAGCLGGNEYLTGSGSESVVFYLLAYAVMTLGVFAVLTYLSGRGRAAESVNDLSGLGTRRPAVALAMAVFLFSLTGIPVTAGFWGKLALFSSALACNDRLYTILAVLGVINAVISSYYYLRIIGVMYMREPPAGEALPVQEGGTALAVVATCAVLTLVVGIFPGPFLEWVDPSENQVPAGVLGIVLGAVAVGAVVLLTQGRGRSRLPT